MSELLGVEAALDDRPREAPVFYGTYAVVTIVAVGVVLLASAPLVAILFLTQALNAVLLLPLLIAIWGIVRDRELMGEHVLGRAGSAAALATIVLLSTCIVALLVLTVW